MSRPTPAPCDDRDIDTDETKRAAYIDCVITACRPDPREANVATASYLDAYADLLAVPGYVDEDEA